jgi:hypothetical protein
MHVVTEIEPSDNGAIYARNRYSDDFGRLDRLLRLQRALTRTVTATATEFMGRNGSCGQPGRAPPAPVCRAALGAGARPVRSHPGARVRPRAGRSRARSSFILGAGTRTVPRPSRTHPAAPRQSGPRVWPSRRSGASGLDHSAWSRWRHPTQPERADSTAGCVYQVLSCRMWGAQRPLPVRGRLRVPRPAAGQRSPSLHTLPDLTRDHLLRSAQAASSAKATCSTGGTRPPGAACRTHCLRRLPLAALRREPATSPSTGDTGVLGELVPFLDGPRPVARTRRATGTTCRGAADLSAPLYEHCPAARSGTA